MKRGSNRQRRRADIGSSWISYSDMMASLLLLFVLVLCFSMYQFLSMLETKTAQLNEQSELLTLQQTTLDEQQNKLTAQQITLDEQQDRLLSLQSAIDLQKDELHQAQTRLDEQQTLLAAQQTNIENANHTLVTREAQLAEAQSQLREQEKLLDAQQKKLDDLVGVRSQIVRELTHSLNANQINAKVDQNTGDIMLESAVFFEFGKNVLTPSGQQFLRKFVPVYLNVLLKEENRNYLGEIIIEGHTDSEGSYITNLKLSQQRALAVATFCLEMNELTLSQRQMLESILTATGKSESKLIYHIDGTENADASRRVEFKFRLKDTEMIDEIRKILGESNGSVTMEEAQ